MENYEYFNKLKLTRNWIGGNKKSEHKIFSDLLDQENEFKNADWVEYRRKYIEFSNDYKIFIASWKYVLNIVRYVFVGLALLTLLTKMYVLFGIILVVSLATTITHKVIEKKEGNFYATDKTNIDFTNFYIKEETGIDIK